MDLRMDNHDNGMEYQFWEGNHAVYYNQYKKLVFFNRLSFFLNPWKYQSYNRVLTKEI